MSEQALKDANYVPSLLVEDRLSPRHTQKVRGILGSLGTFDLADFCAQRFDYEYGGTGNLIYAGYAAPGHSESDPVWQIRKYEYSGGNVTAVKFAEGSLSFDKKWSERASYNYA